MTATPIRDGSTFFHTLTTDICWNIEPRFDVWMTLQWSRSSKMYHFTILTHISIQNVYPKIVICPGFVSNSVSWAPNYFGCVHFKYNLLTKEDINNSICSSAIAWWNVRMHTDEGSSTKSQLPHFCCAYCPKCALDELWLFIFKTTALLYNKNSENNFTSTFAVTLWDNCCPPSKPPTRTSHVSFLTQFSTFLCIKRTQSNSWTPIFKTVP